MPYIGISENRLHHIIGVARKAYSIAKERGYNEDFARRCFMLGWLHDTGYEFCSVQDKHPDMSEDLMKLIVVTDVESLSAVKNHGRESYRKTLEYTILNTADMTTDSKGRDVTPAERLRDIKERYGEESIQYITARDICRKIGLIPG